MGGALTHQVDKANQQTPNTKEKRKHTYDDPAPVGNEVNDQYSVYKLLEVVIKSEAHKGHCYIENAGGCDNHRWLSHCSSNTPRYD